MSVKSAEVAAFTAGNGGLITTAVVTKRVRNRTQVQFRVVRLMLMNQYFEVIDEDQFELADALHKKQSPQQLNGNY